jgi:hypothetical protein
MPEANSLKAPSPGQVEAVRLATLLYAQAEEEEEVLAA